MPILIAILVFFSAFAIDFAETRYITAVSAKDPHRAAAWSLVMYTMGALGWVAIIKGSLWLMIPEALGFYCGTRYALRK